MDMLVFGHAGARALVFPTAQGRFYDWEDHGMINALARQLEEGWLQLYCVDSVDEESWFAGQKLPGDRAWRHLQYEGYVRDEVLPVTRLNDNAFMMTLGADFGAWHAVTFAMRYPTLVGRTIGMSGVYDIRQETAGYSDANVYAFNPADFVLNEHDPQWLHQLSRLEIILAVGGDDPVCADNKAFSERLWSRDVWHALRIWDGEAHDWPSWQQMVLKYIGGAD